MNIKNITNFVKTKKLMGKDLLLPPVCYKVPSVNYLRGNPNKPQPLVDMVEDRNYGFAINIDGFRLLCDLNGNKVMILDGRSGEPYVIYDEPLSDGVDPVEEIRNDVIGRAGLDLDSIRCLYQDLNDPDVRIIVDQIKPKAAISRINEIYKIELGDGRVFMMNVRHIHPSANTIMPPPGRTIRPMTIQELNLARRIINSSNLSGPERELFSENFEVLKAKTRG